MALKRSREELLEVSVEKLAMANCVDIMKRNESLGLRKLFKCKKCKRAFESFQALGGHVTSHKNKSTTTSTTNDSLPVKPKKHRCYLCGEEFALGQALGGHMRKHRDELNQLEQQKKKLKGKLKSGEFAKALHKKNSKSIERSLSLDLNLTPHENDQLMTQIIPF